MKRSLLILGAAGGLLAGPLSPASAQRVTFDQVSGKYTVEYHSSHLGRTVSVVVDPPNRIEPALHLVRVHDANGTLVYQYEASNGRGNGSRQAVVEFEFNCPRRGLVSGHPARAWDISLGTVASRHVCAFIEGSEGEQRISGIQPGGRLPGFEVRTTMLPTLGVVYFWGNTEEVRWPNDESAEVRDSVIVRTVQRLNGVTGGWVERVAVVPVRDPQLSSIQILEGLREDLEKICQTRIWIAAPLCASYRSDLAEIVAAAREERFSTASQRVQDLMADLDSARDAPQGELQADAYWLLRTNLETVRGDLDDGLSAVIEEGRAGLSVHETPAPEVRASGAKTLGPGFWSRLWSALLGV